MPSFCAVSNCEQKYSHSENVSFHKFPLRSPKILIEWIKFTNRGTNWKPSRWNSICSRHFDKSDFREYLSRKCLKKDAIPTIVTKNNISYETYHISSGSPEDTRTLQSEHDDFNPLYGVSIADDSKTSSELFETCRLCGERADNLTCVPLRALDDPEINHMLRKCLPAVNIHVNMDQSRVICLDCGGQLRQFSDFIDKVLVYQREMGLCENFDSFVVSDNNFVNCNQSKCCIKSSTPNPSTAVFIKQEPINVKQEIVDNRRPFTVQLPMLSPSLCLNPFAESKKIKGLMQQEINSPKSEIGSTYCRDCDRIFVNNHEFRSHKCSNAEQSDREQGNNCEIMEVITLNNPVSFIDLAEDENATNLEPRKLKIEGFGEFQQRMRLEFEHAYAKRATSASCNLKQEIIDSYNDSSQNGYENQCHLAENDEQMFNQNSFIEDTHCIYFDCSKCNQSFVSQELHDEHLANMHPLKHKICAICNAEFKSSFEYLIHKSKVHTQRFQCRQCKQKFNTQTILRFHERLCTRQSKDSCIPCRRCGKSMRNLASMKRHLNICIEKQTEIKDERQHQSQKVPQEQTLSRFTCDICDLTFSRLKHFKQHKELHLSPGHTPKKLECINEPINFSDAKGLSLDNLTNIDSVAQSFKFIVDDSKFIFLNESKIEPINQPSDAASTTFNGKFACDTCGRPFSSFLQLKQHKVEHDSERKFSCSLCPKTFKGISGLKQHISGYHYKIKPFCCSVCNYSYALKGDMQRCRHSKLKNHSGFKIV